MGPLSGMEEEQESAVAGVLTLCQFGAVDSNVRLGEKGRARAIAELVSTTDREWETVLEQLRIEYNLSIRNPYRKIGAASNRWG